MEGLRVSTAICAHGIARVPVRGRPRHAAKTQFSDDCVRLNVGLNQMLAAKYCWASLSVGVQCSGMLARGRQTGHKPRQLCLASLRSSAEYFGSIITTLPPF